MSLSWAQKMMIAGSALTILILALLAAVYYFIDLLIIAIVLWILIFILAVLVAVLLWDLWSRGDDGGCAPILIILISVSLAILTFNYIVL
ncbi:MAG: hypothetical protein ACFFA8_05745 [Promethearchaeota archaeon]